MTRTAWWLIGLAGLVLLGVSTVGLLTILGAPGTRIFVTNAGPERLAHVVVHANDKALPIGPLQPGETRFVIARPGEGSAVGLEYTTTDGSDHFLETTDQVQPWARSGRLDLTIRHDPDAAARSGDRGGIGVGPPAGGPEQPEDQRGQDDHR